MSTRACGHIHSLHPAFAWLNCESCTAYCLAQNMHFFKKGQLSLLTSFDRTDQHRQILVNHIVADFDARQFGVIAVDFLTMLHNFVSHVTFLGSKRLPCAMYCATLHRPRSPQTMSKRTVPSRACQALIHLTSRCQRAKETARLY